MVALPTDIDATYPDSVDDPSVQLHQQLHDEIHGRLKSVVVHHGTSATVARPDDVDFVVWVGTVAPTNKVSGDYWKDVTNDIEKRWDGSVWQLQGHAIYRALPQHTTTPEAHGAVGNTSGHDDAAAIEAAIASVVASCVADGSYVCEVVFDASKIYYANRAPVGNPTINGVASLSFAQIGLPYLPWTYVAPNSPPMVTVILRSTAGSQQGATSSFVEQPCAIKSTPTTGGGAGIYGAPSIIGGPAIAGTPAWSAIKLVVDGVNIVAPPDPPFTGIDASYLNAIDLPECRIYVPTLGFADPAACTTPQAWGVQFPLDTNGGVVRFGSLEVCGFYSGIRVGEHLDGRRYYAFGNQIAIEPVGGTQSSHIAYFDDVHNVCGIASNPGSPGAPVTVNVSPAPCALVIDMWNFEAGSPSNERLFDTNNLMTVVANYCPADGPGHPPNITGGAKSKITDVTTSRLPGPFTVDPPTAQGVTTVPSGVNFATAARVVSPGGPWKITQVGVIIGNTSGHIAIAHFRDNGSGAPGALVATTGSIVTPANGQALVSLATTVETGDWLAIAADNVTVQFLAAVAPGGWGYPQMAARATYWSVGAGLTFASNPGSLTADSRAVLIWGQ